MITSLPFTGRRRRLSLLALVLAFVLIAAACGDDDASDDLSADESGEEESADATDGGDEGPSDDAGTEATEPRGDDGFCGDLETYAVDAVALTSSFFTADSDAIREAAAPLRGDTEAVEASAPSKLAADVVLVNDNYLRVIDTLEASDYDLESLATIGADPPEVTAAWARINDYAVTECGFDPEAMAGDARPAG